jgi:hypothetical protein
VSAKPYCVSYGWCHENRENFETFAEALAFYQTNPGGRWGQSICNTDNMDGGEFDGETGEEIISDGLTEEESEATL